MDSMYEEIIDAQSKCIQELTKTIEHLTILITDLRKPIIVFEGRGNEINL